MATKKTATRAPARPTPPRTRAVKTAPSAHSEPLSENSVVDLHAATSQPSIEVSKKAKKQKVVRDSFTMPKMDYDHFAALKQRCLAHGLKVKKSELLRAGLHALQRLDDANLMLAVGLLENVKTGRPLTDTSRKVKQPVGKRKRRQRNSPVVMAD